MTALLRIWTHSTEPSEADGKPDWPTMITVIEDAKVFPVKGDIISVNRTPYKVIARQIAYYDDSAYLYVEVYVRPSIHADEFLTGRTR